MNGQNPETLIEAVLHFSDLSACHDYMISPLGLDKWFVAVWCIANDKNGISSCELGRALGVTQKTAWFMLHRIRLAMCGVVRHSSENAIAKLIRAGHKVAIAEPVTDDKSRGGLASIVTDNPVATGMSAKKK